MKQYQQLDENGESFQIGGLSIPVDPGNRDYARMQDEIAAGEAEILPFVAYVPTYAEQRREAYGSIGDQLDMQYHDAVDGTATWKDHVAAVKAAHPKP